MPLNKQQQEAVDYIEGPLLVLAGPGTGKTQLLSSKVAHILEVADTNPENILCLTFTESGAGNMRDRLFSMIGQAAGQVAIHTYHAFGSVVLSAYKNYATEFDRNLDSPIDPVTQYKIVKNILAGLDGRDILRGDQVKDVVEVISNAKSARLTADDLHRIVEDNLAVTAELTPLIQEPLSHLVPRMKVPDALERVYYPLANLLAEHVSADELAPGVTREVNTLVLELKKVIEEQETAAKPSVAALNKWKDKRFERAEDGSYRFKNLIANKKLLSISNVMHQYDDHLAAEGLFDFSDMIEQAIKILKSDRGFRLSLSERYQYILLDEFQDTNPSQAELIYLLTDYESPSVMAVGDDDQAIFEFQGANASNLYEFQQHYQAKYINLTDNYRSTSEVLDFARRVADQIEDSFSKNNGVAKVLRSMKDLLSKKPRSSAQVSRHEFLSADGEYYWIGEQISELVKQGVKQSDIAIIAPKHKYIAPLLPYLKSHPEINISYEKRENLFEDQAIYQLLALARFIYELAEEKQPSHRLLEILSFPFWQLNPLIATKVSARDRNKTTLEHLLAQDYPDVQALAHFFADLIPLAYTAPLELFIDYLTGLQPLGEFTCPFAKYYCEDDAHTFVFYDKLRTLRKALKEYLRVDRPTLKDLIAFVDDYTDSNTPLTLTSPYQDSTNAVQIVTAHKSKGLEYEYVFIIATDSLSWGKAKGNNSLLTLPVNLTQIRHTGITDDERLRLFFVAITRAKSHLYLTNSKTDFSGKTPARLEYLAEYEKSQPAADGHEVMKVYSPHLGNDAEVQTHYDDLDQAKCQTDLHLSWISAYREYLPELKPLLLKNLERYALSASDLTSFIDIVYAGPEEFFRRRLLRAESEPAGSSAVFGTLIHAAFERVTNQRLSDEEAIQFFREEVEKQPLLDDERRALAEKGSHALEVSLKTFAPILRAEHAQAEVDLRPEHLHLGETPLDGIIDHLNINPETKEIELYDFKTGNYKPKKWDQDPTLYKYKLQLGFYKLLLNLSPTYSRYRVTKAHILFVSPDELDDEVHDKIYEYNDRDEAELKQLIQAVYQQIKTLAFLEDDGLYLSPDKSRNFKDIKKFVELLIEKSEKSA